MLAEEYFTRAMLLRCLVTDYHAERISYDTGIDMLP